MSAESYAIIALIFVLVAMSAKIVEIGGSYH